MIQRVRKDLYIVGDGGHARVVSASAKSLGWRTFFISKESGARMPSVSEEDFFAAQAARQFSSEVICGVGHVGNPLVRGQIISEYSAREFVFTSVVDPNAVVATDVVVGSGTFIAQCANVVSGSNVGRHCILNTGCIVDHDANIGDETHIAPGAIVLGGVNIGFRVLVGAGAVIRQGLSIADDVIIGAGAVVTRSIEESGSIWLGAPARQKR